MPLIQKLTQQASLTHILFDGLKTWLESQPVEPYPFRLSFDVAADKPFIIMHTSGSTGNPKPVIYTHGTLSCLDNFQDLPLIDGRQITMLKWQGHRVFSPLPPFHGAGITLFTAAVYYGVVLVTPPPGPPPNLDFISAILDTPLTTAGAMLPSLVNEVANSPEVLPKIKRWAFLSFGGGPISKEVGDVLWPHLPLYNLYGATETHLLPTLEPFTQDEWYSLAIHPSTGVQFVPVAGTTNLCQIEIIREKEYANFQPVFWSFPNLETWTMSDLFSPAGVLKMRSGDIPRYVYLSRVDDLIVLSNAEKVDPIPIEASLATQPDISAALVVGTDRFQLGLLVEPTATFLAEAQKKNLSPQQRLGRFRDIIDHLNKSLPSHAQIDLSHVAILETSEAFPRAGKGTVQRKKAVTLFSEVIEAMYVNSGSVDNMRATADERLSLDFASLEGLTTSLLAAVKLRFEIEDIDADTSYFEIGMDSLMVTQLTRGLKAAVLNTTWPTSGRKDGQEAASKIDARLVYQKPSARATSAAIWQLLTGSASNEDSRDADYHTMRSMVSKYTQSASRLFDTPVTNGSPASVMTPSVESEGACVLLTGSTGRLGSYLLQTLQTDPKVRKIICLNRSSTTDIETRQSSAMEQYSCDEIATGKYLSHKTELITTDLGGEHLELQPSTYLSLVDQVTHIIHNAWQVNFNLPLSVFETQIAGLQELMQLAYRACARESPKFKKVVFVSSVGAVQGAPPNVTVAEEIFSDPSVAGHNGYAESKWVAEQVLHQLATQSGVPVTVVRVGQVAGRRLLLGQDGKEPSLHGSGSWSSREWLPSLIITAVEMGCIPGDLGGGETVDWVPVDGVAAVLWEMADAKNSSTSAVHVRHLLNPQTVDWAVLLRRVRELSPRMKALEAVSLSEWLSRLKTRVSEVDKQGEGSESAKRFPAFKILDFYEHLAALGEQGTTLPRLELSASIEGSAALKEMEPIRADWVAEWMKGWVVEA